MRAPWRWSAAVVLVAMAIGAISFGAIEGSHYQGRVYSTTEPTTWVPYLMKAVFGYSVVANLDYADVSVKPPGWADRKEQFELVTGARLVGVDLRGATAIEVFLVKADLTEAELDHAWLAYARLEGASLRSAWLERAYLVGARLDGANLHSARLDWAWLKEARLEGAVLREARLEGADLSEAYCLTAEQLKSALTDAKTKLPRSLPTHCPAPDFPTVPDFLRRFLRGRNLR